MGQVFVLPVPWGYQETSFAWAAEGGAGARMASGWNAPFALPEWKAPGPIWSNDGPHPADSTPRASQRGGAPGLLGELTGCTCQGFLFPTIPMAVGRLEAGGTFP